MDEIELPNRQVSVFSFTNLAPGKKQQVDWRKVDATLRSIPPDFTDTRFDPLKHVLGTLSSRNADAELAKLEHFNEQVESLVDDIVGTYYNGFNKAIHHYSDILVLFSDAKEQVDVLREALEVARKRLGSSSTSLQSTWTRNLVLNDTVNLLEEVADLAAVPERTMRYLHDKEYKAAVALLLTTANKLQRREIKQIGALRDVRRDVAHQRKRLSEKLYYEVLREVFFPRQLAGEAAAHADTSTSDPTIHTKTSQSGVSTAAAGPQGPPSSSTKALQLSGTSHHNIQLSGTSKTSLHTVGGEEQQMSSFAERLLADAHAVAAAGKKVSAAEAMEAAVALIGITQAQLHDMTTKYATKLMFKCHQSILQQLLHDLGAMDLPPPPPLLTLAIDLPPPVAAVAATITERQLMTCLQGLEHVKLLQLIASTQRPAGGREALETLCMQEGIVLPKHSASFKKEMGISGEGPSPTSDLNSSHAVRAMMEATWATMQEQCMWYFRLMLSGKGGDMDSAAAAASMPGASVMPTRPQAPVSVTFSFAAQRTQGSGTSAVRPSAWSPVEAGEQGEGGEPLLTVSDLADMVDEVFWGKSPAVLLQDMLGNWAGGPWLVPVVYPVVVRATDDVCRMVESIPALEVGSGETWQQLNVRCLQSFVQATIAQQQQQQQLDSDERGSTGSTASSRQPGSYDATRTPSNLLLRTFLDNYVKLEFLPKVFVDFRAHCTHVLSSPDALRARISPTHFNQPSATSTSSTTNALPPLPAAVFAVEALDRLLSWAAAMPLFASNLAGVVTNLLERVLEGFVGRGKELLGRSMAATMADNPEVVEWMAREPAGGLLGDPYMFIPLKHMDDAEAHISKLTKLGMGTGGPCMEAALARRLVALRPLPLSALVGGGPGEGPQLLQVVAMSDSLDYVAACIQSGAHKHLQHARAELIRLAAMRGTGPQSPTNPGADLQSISDSLEHLRHRYAMLSGYLLRAVRLEVQLFALHFLQELPKSNYMCDEGESKEVDECIGVLSRSEQRAISDLVPLMSPTKAEYVFGSVPDVVSSIIRRLLPDIKGINAHGVARMTHMIKVLQPVIAELGQASGQRHHEAVKAMDACKAYYQMLALSTDALLQQAAATPDKYTPDEWMALLNTQVPGRTVTLTHKTVMERAVGK